MKVLLVHEFYRSSSPSGEDLVFEREKKLLVSKGVEVETLSLHNDLIGTARGPSLLKTAFFTPWSPMGSTLIKEAVIKFSPDIVHFHNTFPLISQAAIWQAKRLNLATVQTLHNFRSVCAQAMLLRAGKVCELCINRYPWPSLCYRCYRSSLAATLPLAANIALNRFLKTWQTKVDRLVVLSEFNRNKFIDAGFPGRKIKIKPNFFEDNQSVKSNERKRNNGWIFVGRLKEEKGVQFLVPVWRRLGDRAPLLNIVGDGPLLGNLKSEIKKYGLEKKIILHGLSNQGRVNELLQEAGLLIFPSICYEGFGLVIGEAFVAGLPVACSRIGTPQYIVQDKKTGIHFEPGNVDDMTNKLVALIGRPYDLLAMGLNARKEYEKKYTPEVNFRMMMEIYEEAIEENKMKRA